MKKSYTFPIFRHLGSVEQLTRTNQAAPLSDVPQGELANQGDDCTCTNPGQDPS